MAQKQALALWRRRPTRLCLVLPTPLPMANLPLPAWEQQPCTPNAGPLLSCSSLWGQEEKEATEDEMVGWHHQLNGHESEQTPRDSEEQGSLACCSPWGRKESDTTEWLNNPSLNATSLPPSLASYRRTWLRCSFHPHPRLVRHPSSAGKDRGTGGNPFSKVLKGWA